MTIVQDDSRAVGRNDYRDFRSGYRSDGRGWGNQPGQGRDGRQPQRQDGRGWGDGRLDERPAYYRGDGYRDDGFRPDAQGGGRGGWRRDDGRRDWGRRDDRDPVSCDVVAQLGILSENRERNTTRELRLVSWNGRNPKLDLRDWGVHPDGSPRCFKGLTLFEDEAMRLRDALVDYFSAKAQGAGGPQAPAPSPAPQGDAGGTADGVPF